MQFLDMSLASIQLIAIGNLHPESDAVIQSSPSDFAEYDVSVVLRHTLAQIDGSDLTASTIVKSINVLMAIRWIKQAWDELKPQTVVNCFKLCGGLPQEQESDKDPFEGLGEDDPLDGSGNDHARLSRN